MDVILRSYLFLMWVWQQRATVWTGNVAPGHWAVRPALTAAQVLGWQLLHEVWPVAARRSGPDPEPLQLQPVGYRWHQSAALYLDQTAASTGSRVRARGAGSCDYDLYCIWYILYNKSSCVFTNLCEVSELCQSQFNLVLPLYTWGAGCYLASCLFCSGGTAHALACNCGNRACTRHRCGNCLTLNDLCHYLLTTLVCKREGGDKVDVLWILIKLNCVII